jgi:hypothetical protein
LKKLHWKEGQEILLVNAPENMSALFGKVNTSSELKNADFIVLFVQDSDTVRNYSESFDAIDLKENVLWVAYPKKSSQIDSDLSRDSLWNLLRGVGLTGVSQRSLNEDWSVIRFKREEDVKHSEKGSLDVPSDLIKVLQRDEAARAFFYSLSATNRKEYILWITGAKKADTRQRRLDQIIDRLNLGLKNPGDKPS